MSNIPAGYIKDFENLGLGLFVHFGLYSIVGKGEWYLDANKNADKTEYNNLINKFNVSKNWAKNLVKTAKKLGAKYITITTRHHDGFSLYDTCGLSNFDAVHSASGRDLIREFVSECNKENIKPFFYHTLIDWNNRDYYNDFNKYMDYLIKSVEILCRNYGKIGGFWFDGMWGKPDGDWQEDRLYGTIRKYQPEAMIINNTGLNELGKVGHYEIDSVTFERGNPCFVDNSDKYRAGEMCQVLNDHWGYTKNDCNYKSVKELVENLVDCRKYNCNFLINTGLKGNGRVNAMDECILSELGKWIKINKGFIYGAKNYADSEGCYVLKDDKYYYAVIKDVLMSADPNVARSTEKRSIKIDIPQKVKRAVWLDNGEKATLMGNNEIEVKPFDYGNSLSVRVLRFSI